MDYMPTARHVKRRMLVFCYFVKANNTIRLLDARTVRKLCSREVTMKTAAYSGYDEPMQTVLLLLHFSCQRDL
jgi:hypothetical protein